MWLLPILRCNMEKWWPWVKGQGHRQFFFLQIPLWLITLLLMVGLQWNLPWLFPISRWCVAYKNSVPGSKVKVTGNFLGELKGLGTQGHKHVLFMKETRHIVPPCNIARISKFHVEFQEFCEIKILLKCYSSFNPFWIILNFLPEKLGMRGEGMHKCLTNISFV